MRPETTTPNPMHSKTRGFPRPLKRLYFLLTPPFSTEFATTWRELLRMRRRARKHGYRLKDIRRARREAYERPRPVARYEPLDYEAEFDDNGRIVALVWCNGTRCLRDYPFTCDGPVPEEEDCA